jgi:indolepyruvate ferredoxin oxidoreductase
LFPGGSLLQQLRAVSRDDGLATLDATRLASALLGDSIGANVLMLGFAFQRGLLPVSGAALYRALELYGRNGEENKLAFDWGRFAAQSPEQVDRLANARDVAAAPATSLPEVIARRVEFLTSYQDRAYAERYRARVDRIAALEARVRPGSHALQEAVARNYFGVLAYKDEYEVARLHTAPEFVDSIRRNFGSSARMSFNFSPPLFARTDPTSGRPRKYELGPWIVPVLRVLAGVRRIRGTWLDPFRYSADRRLERELLRRYEAALDRIEAELDDSRLDAAVRLAQLPHDVRGYGPVKKAAAERALLLETRLWEQFAAGRPQQVTERVRASATR